MLFYYSMLSDDDKRLYGVIYEFLSKGIGEIPVALSGMTRSRVAAVVRAVFNDHPDISCDELFPDYDCLADRISFVSRIYSVYQCQEDVLFLRKFAALADKSCSGAYEKVKYVHDFVVNSVAYDRAEPNRATNHSAMGTFYTGKGVCEGIARFTQLLLGACGISAIYCLGDLIRRDGTDGGLHAWTVVEVDGHYYHMDVSHDVCLTVDKRSVSYRYFLLTHDEILKDRTVELDREIRALTAGASSGYHFLRSGRLVSSESQLNLMLEDTLRRALSVGESGARLQLKVAEKHRAAYGIPYYHVCMTAACRVMERLGMTWKASVDGYDEGNGIYSVSFSAV